MSTKHPSLPPLVRRPPDAVIPGAEPPSEPDPERNTAARTEVRPAPYRGEKLTLYLSDEEVIEIQAYLLELRVNHGMRIDRSRFFRAAMELALANRGGTLRALKRGAGE